MSDLAGLGVIIWGTDSTDFPRLPLRDLGFVLREPARRQNESPDFILISGAAGKD